MPDDFLLLNPGPVPLSDGVRRAMDEPMVSHRSAEFESTYERAQRGLDYVFSQSALDDQVDENGTSLVLNGTATMGMEMAVANLTDRESEVVTLVNGKFGRRFKRIAERHARVTPVEVEWGKSFDLDAVERTITDADADLVTMIHNETSTGLLNPVEAVGELTAAHEALFVVDGVTSIGGDEFCVGDWNVDLAITDAQKALAAPPGVSAMYVTERAADAADGESAPFYEDLEWYLRKSRDNQTPFTSAVPLFRALAVAVEEIREEGMETRIRRHRRQSQAFRAGFEAFGLERFPEAEGPTRLSNTLIAIELPDQVKAAPEEFFGAIAERNVSISGGQAHLSGQIFRVSNMGRLTSTQVLRGIRTVGDALNEVGVECDVEAGVETATEQLNE